MKAKQKSKHIPLIVFCLAFTLSLATFCGGVQSLPVFVNAAEENKTFLALESSSNDATFTSPPSNATDVPLNTTLTIKWQNAPLLTELNLTPKIQIANVTKNFGSDGVTYIYEFAEQLQPNTVYNVTLVYGEENNTQIKTWSFTTTSAPSLISSSLVGATGATAFAVVALTLTFRKRHN